MNMKFDFSNPVCTLSGSGKPDEFGSQKNLTGKEKRSCRP